MLLLCLFVTRHGVESGPTRATSPSSSMALVRVVTRRGSDARVERRRENGGNVEIKIYPGATHSFDSPSHKRQKVDANAEATEDAVERSRDFFARYLRNGERP